VHHAGPSIVVSAVAGVGGAHFARGRDELEQLCCELLARGVAASTLDLVGLTTRDHLLAFGDWVIDGRHRRTRAMFRGLAEAEVLQRLGVTTVRIVGCNTATSDRARTSSGELADILGMPVTGTTELLRIADGMLVSCAPNGTRMLDLDAVAIDYEPHLPVASEPQTRAILAAIRRDAGTTLPGLLAVAHSTVALPSGHRIEVLLDDELVRIGDLVFPVADPRGLRAALPA